MAMPNEIESYIKQLEMNTMLNPSAGKLDDLREAVRRLYLRFDKSTRMFSYYVDDEKNGLEDKTKKYIKEDWIVQKRLFQAFGKADPNMNWYQRACLTREITSFNHLMPTPAMPVDDRRGKGDKAVLDLLVEQIDAAHRNAFERKYRNALFPLCGMIAHDLRLFDSTNPLEMCCSIL